MRKQFVNTVTDLLRRDDRVVLLLADISVFAFREARAEFPDRVINVGVSEQGMTSVAAGLARAGFYPICHTIDPFAIGRAYEQIKVGFGIQGLGGCFVTVGASYDYSVMGPTHHGPEGVALMLTVPGMQVHVPAYASEVNGVLRDSVERGSLSYLRLTEDRVVGTLDGSRDGAVLLGTPCDDAMVVAVGPTIRHCDPADKHAVLYVCTVSPFPAAMFRVLKPKRILVLEPFYTGTLTHLIQEALYPEPVTIRSIGVPRDFLTRKGYGTREEIDRALGFTEANVKLQLDMLMAE